MQMPADKLIDAADGQSRGLHPQMTRLDFDTLATAGSFADLVEEKAFLSLGASSDAMTMTDSSKLPRWVEVTNDGRRFVVSLPWAWHEGPHIDGLALVKTVGSPRVEVRDPRWGRLLELVSGGFSPGAVNLVTELVERNGLGEIESPVVAALIGTILVLSAESTLLQIWDEWLEDKARSHADVPDCAAVLGARHLQCRCYDEGEKWLRESVSRGLPFLSSTFSLLSLGFAQLEDDVQLRRISRALVSVDPSQPFTTLELRPPVAEADRRAATSRPFKNA
jgi:hypothetical protein